MLKENEFCNFEEQLSYIGIYEESFLNNSGNSEKKKKITENHQKLNNYELNHPLETRNKGELATLKKNTKNLKSNLTLDTKVTPNNGEKKSLIGNTKILSKKPSSNDFNSKLKTNYKKFIEINRSKFRNSSPNKTEIKKSRGYNDFEHQGTDVEGLLSSIKTDKIKIISNKSVDKNTSISKLDRRTDNVSISKQLNDFKITALEKDIKEDMNNAQAKNVKFFALSHWKTKHNDGYEAVYENPDDNYFQEDSIQRLRMTNDALFRHRSTPLNPKSKSLYSNSRTFNLKNQLIPVHKEENNLNLLITSKGILDLPSVKKVKVNTTLEDINNHKMRMEMIINNNKKLKKAKMSIGNNIEERAVSSVASDSKLQCPNDILLFQDICETFNNYQRERANKSANHNKLSLFLTEDKKYSTHNNFFNKQNAKEVIFQTGDITTGNKNKFNNFEHLKNTVFGVRNTSSNTRFSTTGKSKNNLMTISSQTLTTNSIIRPKSLYQRSFNRENTKRRIVSGQDNKISHVLYSVFNKQEADSAIQKHKIF